MCVSQPAGREWLAIAGLVAMLALAGGQSAYGQRLRVSQPSKGINAGIQIGRIANTSVDRNFRTYSGLNSPSAAPLPTSQAPAVPTVFGGRMGIGRDLVAQMAAGQVKSRVRNDWLRRLSPGGAAQYFQPRSRLGGRTWGRVVSSFYEPLLSPETLAVTNAFTAPAVNQGIPFRIPRDPLSQQDVPEAPYVSGATVNLEEGYTQAEMMSSRLEFQRQRVLQEAWEWFRLGDYLRARSAFERAEMLDRQLPDARVGIFFCSVAERKHAVAYQNLLRILDWDLDKDIFGSGYRMAARYPAIQKMRRDHNAFVGYANRFIQAARGAGIRERLMWAVAAASFASWHMEQKREALRGAQQLVDMDPGGQFAKFGLAMREAYEADLAAAERDAASGPPPRPPGVP